MAVVVATRHNPHIKEMNERLLANGKTKMMAIGAAMRKLVHFVMVYSNTNNLIKQIIASILNNLLDGGDGISNLI